jgi:hypothetical protein
MCTLYLQINPEALILFLSAEGPYNASPDGVFQALYVRVTGACLARSIEQLTPGTDRHCHDSNPYVTGLQVTCTTHSYNSGCLSYDLPSDPSDSRLELSPVLAFEYT